MDEETYEQFSMPHAASRTAGVHAAVDVRADARRRRQAVGVQMPSSVELAVAETEPGVQGRHGLERDEAGDARDRRRRPGAALREPGRPDQGRPARSAATSAAPDDRPGGTRLAKTGYAALSLLATLQPAARTSVLFHRPTHRERRAGSPGGSGLDWMARIAHCAPGSNHSVPAHAARSSTPRSGCSRRSRSRAACRPRRCSSSPRCSTRPGSPASRSPAAASSTRAVRARRREPVGADPRAQGANDDAARARVARPLPRRLAPGRRRLRRAASSPARPRAASTSSASTTRSTTSRTCARPARRSSAAGKEFDAGSSTAPGRPARPRRWSSRRSKLPRARRRRACCSTTPPARSQPHQRRRARRARSPRPPGCRSGSTARARPERARRALEAARAGRRPDRLRRLPGRARRCTASPASRSPRRWRGSACDTGVDVDVLWEASDLVDEHIGDEPVDAARAAHRRACRRARPSGRARRRARRPAARPRSRRPAARGARRARARSAREAGWPPLAAPIGQILASQALVNVLSARRYGTVVDELRGLVQGALRHAAGRRSTRPSRAR